ncbi:MAG: hypothetical protein V4439_03380 [Patescibacteria group bacterium]
MKELLLEKARESGILIDVIERNININYDQDMYELGGLIRSNQEQNIFRNIDKKYDPPKGQKNEDVVLIKFPKMFSWDQGVSWGRQAGLSHSTPWVVFSLKDTPYPILETRGYSVCKWDYGLNGQVIDDWREEYVCGINEKGEAKVFSQPRRENPFWLAFLR